MYTSQVRIYLRYIIALAFIAGMSANGKATLLAPMMSVATPQNQSWTIDQQGDFEVIWVRAKSNEFDDPGETSINDRVYAAGWLCVRPSRQISAKRISDRKPFEEIESGAKIELPNGSDTYADLIPTFERTPTYCIEIPGMYPPGTRWLKVTLFAKGLRDTVLTIHRPPATISVAEDGGSAAVEVDGVKVWGEAFPAIAPSSKEVVGMGHRTFWSGLDKDLLWRMECDSVQSQYVPAVKGKRIRTGYSTIELTPDRRSITQATTMSFAQEAKFLPIRGRLRGCKTVQETVDFGTVPVLKKESVFSEGNHEKVVRDYFFDFDQPLERTLLCGVKVRLLPCKSHKGAGVQIGDETLYYRLEVDRESLARAMGRRLGDTQGISAEAKHVAYETIFTRVEPPVETYSKISHLRLRRASDFNAKEIRLVFEIRCLGERKTIPFDLVAPVEPAKAIEATWRYRLPTLSPGLFAVGTKQPSR